MATNNQINSPVKLPTTVGNSGQAMLSDGAGNSAWGAPAGSRFFKTTGTSFAVPVIPLLASFMDGQLIVNNSIGPCTWTADTAANYSAQFPGLTAGDTLQVFVSNPTAALVTVLGGVGVLIFGGPTVSTNFSFLLRFVTTNNWDLTVA